MPSSIRFTNHRCRRDATFSLSLIFSEGLLWWNLVGQQVSHEDPSMWWNRPPEERRVQILYREEDARTSRASLSRWEISNIWSGSCWVSTEMIWYKIRKKNPQPRVLLKEEPSWVELFRLPGIHEGWADWWLASIPPPCLSRCVGLFNLSELYSGKGANAEKLRGAERWRGPDSYESVYRGRNEARLRDGD